MLADSLINFFEGRAEYPTFKSKRNKQSTVGTTETNVCGDQIRRASASEGKLARSLKQEAPLL